MDDVGDLVITPFRDIVEKGHIAIQNAGDTQPVMLKAAQALLKEGERALKRIEPLCRKLFDEYGYNFHDALKANDDIAQYRAGLNDLLWEFDDYIEADDFDADRFAELQAQSRRAAPKIYDILMRMKLDVPDAHSLSRMPITPTSPIPRYSVASLSGFGSPSPAAGHAASSSASRPNSRVDSLSVHDVRQDEAPHSEAVLAMPQPPPPPPSIDPWDVQASSTAPATDDGHQSGDYSLERRAPVEQPEPESPVDPMSPFSPPESQRRMSSAPSQDSGDGRSRTASTTNHTVASPVKYNLFPSFASRPRAPTVGTNVAPSIPEEGGSPKREDGGNSPTLGHSPQIRHPSQAVSQTSVEALPLSPSDTRPSLPLARRLTVDSQLSGSPAPSSDALPDSEDQPGLEVAAVQTSRIAPEQDWGPIPVDAEAADHQPSLYMSSQNCNVTSSSSFYLNKGFCEGAKEVTRGGIGVKKTKKPVGLTTAVNVARCTSCMCELDFNQIETDVCKQEAGNHIKAGISYRLRFLQKSHLPAKRVDDVMYGCVFCIKLGRTIDESDSTVFFNPKALFEHLNRHPRPLPQVDGVTVVDAVEMPLHLRNDYDLHFTKPWEPHPVLAHAAEIAQRPSATAREPARRLYGQRLLFDRTPALELAQGARITGITWPAKHNGEWAMGWHDGQYASVPTDLLKLDAPPNHQIKMAGSSLIQARARWKFAPKGGDKERGDWLKFEKNEVISSISWTYFEHWCWSGTNSKGKWGIFPQVFMDTNTVSEPSGSDRARSLSMEKGRSMSMLSKFGMKKQTSMRVPPTVTYQSAGGREGHQLSGL